MSSEVTTEINKPRSFPAPRTQYYPYIENPNYKAPLLKWLKYLNKIIVPLYRLRILPLLGAGRMMYVMTIIGRKTGKKRRVPLEYAIVDGIMHGGVINPKKSQWFRNVQANPDVWVQIGFRTFPARIEILDDEGTIECVKWYIRTHPSLSKFWGRQLFIIWWSTVVNSGQMFPSVYFLATPFKQLF